MPNATIAAGFNVKNMSQNGCFEGYASLFDVTDQVHDRVARGAFAKTLADWRRKGRMPPLLWQHDAREPIGAWRDMKEDDRGLFVRGELFVNEIPRALQAWRLMRENALSGLSIGFKAVESERDGKTGERILTRVELMEVSMVTFPALDAARVSSVKAALASGDIPGEREFEAFLRDAGFSRKQAKGVVARGYRALTRRDAGGGAREETLAALAALAGSIRSAAGE